MARREQPDRLGRYELMLPIARGGMGAVYLARTVGLEGFERAIALKIVDKSEEPELARDLVEEAKLAARIHHRHVVGVLDVGVEDDIAFLAMEYVEGPSLASLVKAAQTAGGTLPRGVAMRILLDMLAGLHAAHELADASGVALGIVHRDVSPANVLVGRDGVSKLTDFGIARALSRSSNTSTGVVKGKFSYMGPEQARGAALDRRADIWSAGVVAWELVTGAKLFPLGNDASTLLAIVGEEPPYASTVADDVPHSLDAAISSALQRDPKARCSSAEALATALEAACASSGLEIGSHADVAAAVQRFCGTELEERRAKSDAVRISRQALRPSQPRAQSSTDLLTQPPPLHTIPLETVEWPPAAAEDSSPPAERARTVEAGTATGAPVLSMPFPSAPSEPSTFRPASGIIDRRKLFSHRTKWAGVAAGVVVLSVGVVSAGILSRSSPQLDNGAASSARAASPQAAPSHVPASDTAAASVELADGPSTAAAGTTAPSAIAPATPPSHRTASGRRRNGGTSPASQPAVTQSNRTSPPKLVEDDPYKRRP